MESNFNNRDFEQFVKQNADQYRMYPSEKVWGGINKALHTRRRWYGIGLALLLLLTGGGVALVMMTTSNKTNQQSTLLSPPVINYNELPDDESNSSTDAIAKSGPIDFSETKTTKQTTAGPGDPTVFDELLAAQRSGTITATETIIVTVPVAGDNIIAPKEEVLIAVNTPVLARKIIKPSAEAKEAEATLASASSAITVRDEDVAAADETKKKTEATASHTNNPVYPLTIESVVNSFKAKPRKTISWQVHISPTVSYRRLSENKGFLQEAALNGYIPIVSAYGEAKDFVIHKPDFGLELGVAARYPLTKNITIKGGLQFNVSRYDIKAYKYDREIATINLDQGNGNNSISTSTVYRTRTRTDDGTNWLQNLYYSASLPVGVEYKFASRKSTQFGVAATIQPTYVITNRAYLLSTDYKNYVEIPSLTRRVNLNTGFEAFVSYKAKNGDTKWQIGPQVRYQLKSSFINTYPVKENLFDFGLKVGVILNNK